MKSAPKLRILLVLITLVLAGSGASLLLTKSARAGQHESPPPPGIDQGLKALESNEQSLILEYTTPGYQIQTVALNGEQCQLLEVEGFGATDQVGWPQVPIKGFLIGIPAGEPPTIEILQAEAVVSPETYNLCPVGKPRITDNNIDEELRYTGLDYVKDPDGYSIDHFTPEALVELGEPGYVRSQRVAQIRLQPFQYNPVSGELRYYKNIRVRVNFNVGTDNVRTLDQNFMDEGPFEGLLRDSLVNYGPAQGWRAAPRPPLQLSQETVLDTSQAYKIFVEQDGIFQISYADLQTAGVPVDEINPNTFKIHNQGMETAIYVAGEDDSTFAAGEYLLFYGQKFNSKYTDTNVYWLTWGGANGKRMPEYDGTPSGLGSTPDYFKTNLHLEEDHSYQSSRPSGLEDDHWYWTYIQTPGILSRTFTFSLQNISTNPVSATVSGLLRSYSASPQHHTVVKINGHTVDDAFWSSGTEYSFEADVSQEYLQEGANEITVEAPLDGGITSQILFINWFDVDYYDTYAAEDDILWFDGELLGDQIFELSGFSDPDIDQDDVLFDITQPFTPTRVINADVQLISSDYQLRFEQTLLNERHYLAFSPSRRLAPSGIIPDAPSDLRNPSNGADYIVITHQDFYADVLPLAAQRASQGLRVEAVKLQDVFDEFSDGIYDPEAIRSFLSYAYANWALPAPSYVLLVGDGNYDFKDNFGRGELNYIPPYLANVDPWMGETASDNRYVSVNGTDILPDMNIGRLPVKTSLEAQAMVAKILDYEGNTSTEELNRKVLFVADDADVAGDFAAYSDAVADNYLPAPYQAEKIYYGENYTDPAETQTAIVNAINDGRLMVSYIGHASYIFWAEEELLNIDMVNTLLNQEKLAFFVPMTCYDGYFIRPSSPETDYSSIGEVVARAPDKGAVASWSPTGLGVATGHDILEKGLFEAIFYDNVTQIGPATTQAKINLYANSTIYRELIDTYVLFGDPYTRLQVADINTSITGAPVDPSSSADARFTFTSSETGSTFECRLDGGEYAACTSPKDYTGLSDGEHTFYVRAIDAVGNPDPTPAAYTWEIAISAQGTSITSAPVDPSSSADARFTFTSSESGSTFECRLDGGAYAACTSPKYYTGLSDGGHTFYVRAIDAVGNPDPTPAFYTWVIDTPAPQYIYRYLPLVNK